VSLNVNVLLKKFSVTTVLLSRDAVKYDTNDGIGIILGNDFDDYTVRLCNAIAYRGSGGELVKLTVVVKDTDDLPESVIEFVFGSEPVKEESHGCLIDVFYGKGGEIKTVFITYTN
jgi:hypothetical protein